VDLAGLISEAAARILIVGNAPDDLESALAERPVQVLHASSDALSAIPEGRLDCVVIGPCAADDVGALLAPVAPLVQPHGSICLTLTLEDETSRIPDPIAALWQGLNFVVLRSAYLMGDGRTEVILELVRNTYDAVAHARDLEQANMPHRALIVLESVAGILTLNDEQKGLIAAEKLRVFSSLALRKPAGDSSCAYFAHARKEFQLAVHAFPRMHAAYRRQAELWHHIGHDAMAARLLTSICHVEPDEESLVLLASLNPGSAPQPEAESAPLWTGARRAPRILVITHDDSDYGMDSLYDGLCTVLGKENVVEFPWKATLHGQANEEALNYPCVFDYPGDPMHPEAIEQQLRDGRFDLILFADVVQMAYRDFVRRFLDAAPDLPVVVYDPWDDNHLLLPMVLEYLGRPSVAAYFKREMIAGFDYGPNSFSLPFGYPDRLVPDRIDTPRTQDLFWAGKRVFGTRSLYLDYLQARGHDLTRRYSQEEYRQAIATARVGLSFFGFGYDTVRYWELPAHGVMLLAERPPLRIPHNFVDGESALFFDDLPELEERLAYVFAHPRECAEIAQAGAAHFLKHHTASARARQFLGRLELLLDW
jgi:hypothetical protein